LTINKKLDPIELMTLENGINKKLTRNEIIDEINIHKIYFKISEIDTINLTKLN
jgi:hypothetical protein